LYVTDTADPDGSFGSSAEAHAHDIKPNFTIVRVRNSWRKVINDLDSGHVGQWRSLKVDYVGIPIIVEVKRPPSRKLKGVDFEAELSTKMNGATQDLERQARYLFADTSYSM
jgi:hypothetical protein